MFSMAQLRSAYSRFLRVFIPIAVVAFLGYASYIFLYLLCVKEIKGLRQQKATAVGLTVGYCILLASVLINWIMIFVNGSGILKTRIEPYKLVTFVDENGLELPHQTDGNLSDSLVPDYFYCSENGYPYYCSACNSIKPLRTHHSSELNRCVAKMDHFCIWIGSIVVLLVFIPDQITRRRHTHHNGQKVATYLNPNLGILLYVSFIWIGLLAGLVGQHLYLISQNQTTIEQRKHSRERKRLRNGNPPAHDIFVNVLYKGTRHILCVSPIDKPFKKSTFKECLQEVYGKYAFFSWFIPLNFSSFFDSTPKHDIETQVDEKIARRQQNFSISTSMTLSHDPHNGMSPAKDSSHSGAITSSNRKITAHDDTDYDTNEAEKMLPSPSNSPKSCRWTNWLKNRFARDETEWMLKETFSPEYLQSLYNRIENGESITFQTQVVIHSNDRAPNQP